ncbi:hypothetical protein RE6C_01614 [Rhodopirellula europaea 6C]|uniref:Uncharacterized protein n=1 Tax=Rhodopirellula europaea 6C TaxID=1263867 RepID=M2B625_9BACT|nr:hypothetical protein RE6C_01614 [Rhodopirellula europaea 6C]
MQASGEFHDEFDRGNLVQCSEPERKDGETAEPRMGIRWIQAPH